MLWSNPPPVSALYGNRKRLSFDAAKQQGKKTRWPRHCYEEVVTEIQVDFGLASVERHRPSEGANDGK